MESYQDRSSFDRVGFDYRGDSVYMVRHRVAMDVMTDYEAIIDPTLGIPRTVEYNSSHCLEYYFYNLELVED